MAVLVKINPEEPVLLIDLSYYIFHRFFATQRWYSFRDKEAVENGHMLCDSEEFMNSYKKHFQQDLEKFKKKLAKKTKNPIIFLKDCPRSTIWRNEHIVDYKATRVVSAKMDTRIFMKTYEWIESAMNTTTYIGSCESLEADDLAYLYKNLLRDYNSQQEIYIITNDNDYMQLFDDKCKLYNASLKNICERGKFGCPKKEIRAKILLGDKSDNIKACIPPRYKKNLEEYVSWPEDTLEQFLKAENLYDKYIQNKQLVDFSCIPTSLQSAFQSSYKIVSA